MADIKMDPKRILSRTVRPARSTWDLVILSVQLFIRYTVIGILYLVGFLYLLEVGTNLKQDTTPITNAGFAIFATLSSLSFAWSRSLSEREPVSARVGFAGERFFHASICLLTASILEYAALQRGLHDVEHLQSTWDKVLHYGAGGAVGGLFAAALVFAHTGIVVVNRLLWDRTNRYPEYDRLT